MMYSSRMSKGPMMLTIEDLRQIRTVVEEVVEEIVDRKLDQKLDERFDDFALFIARHFTRLEGDIADLREDFGRMERKQDVMQLLLEKHDGRLNDAEKRLDYHDKLFGVPPNTPTN